MGNSNNSLAGLPLRNDLWVALRTGNIDRYEELCDRRRLLCDAVLLEDGSTILHEIISMNYKDLFRTCMRDEIKLDGRDGAGMTALHRAAGLGRRAMVKTLLDRGADPCLRDQKGRSALDYARMYDHPEVIELLE